MAKKSRYMVWDLETENHHEYKRFANPFSDKNWVVARGWKLQGDERCSWSYHPTKDGKFTAIPDDVVLLIGLNIKFDLLHEWDNPSLQAFFKRGGKIWCCQYAEYLLEGQHPDYHMTSMDQIAEKYGGRVKIDAVKALWEAGMLTSQIDKDMLIDYLVGTEEEKRDSGDIGNTEKIFLGQLKRAGKEKMLPMIQARMDGLLATTEMEYNGLKIDIKEAARRMRIMEQELKAADEELQQYIPELPEGLEFNWASNTHKSALIFGGTIKYVKSAPYLDDKTGEFARRSENAKWPLFRGKPVNPEHNAVSSVGDSYRISLPTGTILDQDRYLSGKQKGSPKFTTVKVPGEIKTKKQDFFFDMPGYTSPMPEWEGAMKDGAGHPIYSTNEAIIEELGSRDIPFLKVMAKRQSLTKDLGTYYLRYDPRKKEHVGMLTCVMQGTHLVHHSLNHTSTVTSRLSSSNPNLQNIPRGDTSEVKKMFISRFDGGKVLEADYSQLEVIIQGMLSGDKNMCEDIRNKVDFHCKRVAAWKGCTYDEAKLWCKDEKHEKYKEWKVYRTNAKVFSFQRAYGAGAAKISTYTGMPIEEVQALIAAEEAMYPSVSVFNHDVEIAVKRSAVAFKDWARDGKTFRRGYYQCPTGTKYTFRTYEAQDWMKKKGVEDSFMPTEIKNYPIQGTGGEVVQIVLGRLFRHFKEMDNYGGKALLCNTVHDSVWFDYHPDVEEELCRNVKEIMESVPEALHTLYGMEVDVPFPVELEVGYNMYEKQVIHI